MSDDDRAAGRRRLTTGRSQDIVEPAGTQHGIDSRSRDLADQRYPRRILRHHDRDVRVLEESTSDISLLQQSLRLFYRQPIQMNIPKQVQIHIAVVPDPRALRKVLDSVYGNV